MARVLVVEDNANLAFAITAALQSEGFDVAVAATGPEGVARARDRDADLIILDLMLPGFDGYRVIRTLRDDGIETPILVLTARGEEADKVRGLRLGADDYVTKPFGLLELLARVDALLRRAARPAAARERFGAVATRDELLREVWRYDASVTSRTVDTHVLELRRKLEDDPANPRFLLTVRKTGYRLQR